MKNLKRLSCAVIALCMLMGTVACAGETKSNSIRVPVKQEILEITEEVTQDFGEEVTDAEENLPLVSVEMEEIAAEPVIRISYLATDEIPVIGSFISMVAHVDGMSEAEASIEWQCDHGSGFESLGNQSGVGYSFTMDEEYLNSTWRAVLNGEKISNTIVFGSSSEAGIDEIDLGETIDASLSVENTVVAAEDIAAGTKVLYEVNIVNNGSVPVNDIHVSATLNGAVIEVGNESIDCLEAGQSEICVFGYVVTQQDIENDSIENTILVTGSTEEGASVQASAESIVYTAVRDVKLAITKTSDKNGIQVGSNSTIEYTVTVENRGNTDLENVSLTDSMITTGNSGGRQITNVSVRPRGTEIRNGEVIFNRIAIGEQKTIVYNYTVTEADVIRGHVTSTSTATAEIITETGIVSDCVEAVNTVYTTSAESKLEVILTSDTDVALAGAVILYNAQIRNIGNVSISDITVSDLLKDVTIAEPGSEIIDQLLPGEERQINYAYVVSEEDILHGSVLCLASAMGHNAAGDTVEAECVCEIPTEMINTDIEVVLESNVTEETGIGGVVSYIARVTNKGNVSVVNIILGSSMKNAEPDINVNPEHVAWADGKAVIDRIEIGETQTVGYRYVVRKSDLSGGILKNEISVIGDIPEHGDTPFDVPIGEAFIEDALTKHMVTVSYLYADGSAALDSVVGSYYIGEEYIITSPVIVGYTADMDSVNGTMGLMDTAAEVTYRENDYVLSIRYRYPDGTIAADKYQAELKNGERFSVDSPSISGYTADIRTVSGRISGANVEVTVIYTANDTPKVIEIDDHGRVLDTGSVTLNVGDTVE